MKYHLNLDWHGKDLERITDLQIRLFNYENRNLGAPLAAVSESQRFRFPELDPARYLLSFRYALDGKHFDSFYFQLEIPDITLIKLELKPQGCQIEQMGFLNDYGEFVDMLIYEGEKPYLTLPVEAHPYLQSLTDFFAYKYAQLEPNKIRQVLNDLVGDLAESFANLSCLWPYQLKAVMQPSILVQTTAEWKACLLHLLRNNLILMDNEKLVENLTEAIELAQQEERVDFLLSLMEWDYDLGTWSNYPGFIEAIRGKTMAI